MTQLEFDEAVASQIESLYLTRDAARRRRLVRETLATQPGDRVLDVGCGPGFYCLEVSDEVGPSGEVVGIDAAPPMLALARRRCKGRDNISFRQGEALSLPAEDLSFDRALSVQVLEYVENATGALEEIYRTLRPGGRVVIWDIDWDTVSWHSSDQVRMKRVLKTWDRHLVHPSLPRTLGPRMRAAGFKDVTGMGHIFQTIGELDPQTYGGAILPIISSYVLTNGLEKDDVESWEKEQQELSTRGEAYFACVQFCFTGLKPT